MAENHTHWLRKENTDQTKASFPELFFDLVFVFALIQLSESLSDDFSLGIAAEAVLFIFALWWVWIHTTWVMDLLDTEIEPVRLLLFTLMFFGIVMAIALPEAFKGMGLLFAVAYSAMQVSRSLFALYAFRRGDPASFMTFFRITAWLTISSTFWITGGLSEPHLRVVLWIVALVVEYTGPTVRYWVPLIGASPRETLDIDGEHLAERSALFVIIALGETILTLANTRSATSRLRARPGSSVFPFSPRFSCGGSIFTTASNGPLTRQKTRPNRKPPRSISSPMATFRSLAASSSRRSEKISAWRTLTNWESTISRWLSSAGRSCSWLGQCG